MTALLRRVLIWSLTCLATPLPAVEQTLELQQGLAGYAGAADTWVSSHDWDNPPQHQDNYGLNPVLTLSRDRGDNPLLRFELGQITANSAVVSATLELYNTTQSSFSGTRDFARRIRLHRVLADWDEGNQVDSPIDQPGDHGATGDFALRFYPGEGTDVPWGERAMQAGVDYVAADETFADVVNEGWYGWDVTALVQAWVRNDVDNYGVVLRDATGYQDDHRDWRDFVSGQGGQASLRPRLVIVYNPDTPLADAGPDQEMLGWDGGAVVLDGSASDDRPGGNPATLEFEWRIASAAYGSALGGVVGGEAVVGFTPDVAGEWELELTVTNDLGESAVDTVRVRVLSISSGHPRIYLSPQRLADLQARAVPTNPTWMQLLDEAADPSAMHAAALVSQVTGTTSYCDSAIGEALARVAEPWTYSTKAGDIALVYDWCHEQLTTAERTTFLGFFEDFAADPESYEDPPGWGNYWPRWGYSFALVGLAAFGDHPEAQAWFDHYRHDRVRDQDIAMLDQIAAGGAWPEGMVYDWIANVFRVKAVAAWHAATGEDLFSASPWFAERLGFFLLRQWPGVGDEWGYLYHPYLSTGDSERNRGSMANYGRIMSLILLDRFRDLPLAAQLASYLAAGPTAGSDDFVIADEYVWLDPDLGGAPPELLTHHAEGTGTVLMRSGWPTGAADTDTGVTYLTFQCGDHFSYHQHYDQGSFTLFKGSDLLLDSGVYSGDGLSFHDTNYYVRTIAHNTLVVYNPLEDLSHARPDAISNDGGQRSTVPATRAPQTVEYWDLHEAHYERGDIRAFADEALYTYVLGDATAAYNNPAYNQAMDSSLAGNVAKVSRFERELVYLRPVSAVGDDFVVLYDRVAVTDPVYSGESTKVLFHTLSEPDVDGAGTEITPGETVYANASSASASWDGASVSMAFLLPEQHTVRLVGGRAVKAFWVFDDSYDWHWSDAEPQPRPVSDFEDLPYGEWRLELEPADTNLEHSFLTVLFPLASGAATMPPTTLITGPGVEGAHIAAAELERVVLFSSAADGSPPAGTITYTYPSAADALNLVVDLAPGAAYALDTAYSQGQVTITLTPDGGGSLVVSDQGVLDITIEAMPDDLFSDGFESGDTSAWSP